MIDARAEEARRWSLVLGGADDLDERDSVLDETLEVAYGSVGGKGRAAGGKRGAKGGRKNDGTGTGKGEGAGNRKKGGNGAAGGKEAAADGNDDLGAGDGRGLGRGRAMGWLEDVAENFPEGVAEMLRKDVIEASDPLDLLLEPELVEKIDPDPTLVAKLLSLGRNVPEAAKASARIIIRRCVEKVTEKLRHRLETAIRGARDPSARTRRPRFADIDWHRTIRANLGTKTPDLPGIIPERLVGRARAAGRAKRDVILCLDQSGSMATSLVNASIVACILAAIPTISTSLVVFDTEALDLTAELHADPVDLLFGVRLGGGTDIDGAIGLCETLSRRPSETTLFLVSDLMEGGDRRSLVARITGMIESGTTVVCLLALQDDGTPRWDRRIGAALAAVGAHVLACSVDAFPDVLSLALEGKDPAEAVERARARAGTSPIDGP
jgi:hypothetical protein